MLDLTHWPLDAYARMVGVLTDVDDTLTTEGAITPDALHAMATLRAAGLHVMETASLPDHADTAELLQQAKHLLRHNAPLLCTEKDAVKLWRTHPEAWAVPLRLQLPQAFWELLDAQLAKANANIRRDGKPA